MRTITVAVIAFSISMAHVQKVNADDKQKAVSLVKQTIEYYKKNGKTKTLDAVTSGKFMEGSFYVMCQDMEAVVLAHPTDKTLIGRKMLDVPDANGKQWNREVVELMKTKGKGWVNFKFMNPSSKKMENKSSYFEKVDDIMFGCGIYTK
jgi:cytochrome c